MKFTASCAELSGLKTDSLILPTGSELSNSAKVVNELTHNSIDSAIESGEFQGKSGQVLVLNLPQSPLQRIIFWALTDYQTKDRLKKLSPRPAKH